MKQFVKVNSIWITVLLSIICVVGLITLPQCVIMNYRWLKLGPETEGLDALGHLIVAPFAIAFLCAETVFFGILIAEMVIVIRRLMQAMEWDTFTRYWKFTEAASLAVLLNIFAFMVFATEFEDLSKNSDGEITRMILVHIVLIICVIMNRKRCRKGKQEEEDFIYHS